MRACASGSTVCWLVIAEKLEALTSLGLLNSRMKDYFDIWLLSRLYEFDGAVLFQAIRATFQCRGTIIESQPAGLTDAFVSDPAKSTQWKAFLRRSPFESGPDTLREVVTEVSAFIGPMLTAAANDGTFSADWKPGSGWQKR